MFSFSANHSINRSLSIMNRYQILNDRRAFGEHLSQLK